MNAQEAIEKIRKLMNLSTSSNDNEAQSAILMAQKLMAQYKIDLSQVKDAPIDHDVLEQTAETKAHRTKWKRILAGVIAQNFQCDIFIRGYEVFDTIFVGKKDNLQICKQVYTAAVKFIDLHFSIFWNTSGKWDCDGEAKPLSYSISLKDSYARGFIAKLKEKFEAQKATADKEGWGLVLVKDADVESYMSKKQFAFRRSNTASSVDQSAVVAGYSDCNSKFGETGQVKLKEQA